LTGRIPIDDLLVFVYASVTRTDGTEPTNRAPQSLSADDLLVACRRSKGLLIMQILASINLEQWLVPQNKEAFRRDSINARAESDRAYNAPGEETVRSWNA
jgi:hypothetical protein